MPTYEVKHLSDEEIQSVKTQYPLSSPKPWAALDGKLVMNYYDSEAEAKAEVAEFELTDRLNDALNVWLEEVAEEEGVDEDKVRELLKGRL